MAIFFNSAGLKSGESKSLFGIYVETRAGELPQSTTSSDAATAKRANRSSQIDQEYTLAICNVLDGIFVTEENLGRTIKIKDATDDDIESRKNPTLRVQFHQIRIQ